MHEPGPHDIDVSKPSAARLYDYYLGGSHNYTVDRAFATHILEGFPLMRDFAVANRAFLRRAVRFCVDQGIRQFLDIGSGIPTVGNVHEIAQEKRPDAHVVYVDNDMDAVVASREMLEGQDTVTAIAADLRQPSAILGREETRRLIDFRQPLALLMVSTLLFVSDDDDVYEIMDTYRDVLPSGSYLVLSHATLDDVTPEIRERGLSAQSAYDDTANPLLARTRDEFARFFGDFPLVEPGIAYATDWRPDVPPDMSSFARLVNYGAVAYKP